jgi:hypothetical protein
MRRALRTLAVSLLVLSLAGLRKHLFAVNFHP